jgi:hypothetical protein
MRAAAASLSLIVERLGLAVDVPSSGTIRSWLLRLGCFALTCELAVGVWVLFIDHTVQIGPHKLLVILGCRVDQLPLGERPLRHDDLSLVGLSLMEKSNDQTVFAELEAARRRVGEVRQIVSDQASDLNGGVRLLQQRQPGVAHVHDVAHLAANVLKRRRAHDQPWSEFIARLAQAGAKVRQTREAFLRPPTVRAKARFMNVASTLRFAGRVLKLLDTGRASARAETCYGWLRECRDSLTNWSSEQAVVETTLTHIRVHGLHATTTRQLNAQWLRLELTAGANEVAAELRLALSREAVQAHPGETLVASTEVLESVQGKLKRLEASYANDGFTGLSLALGALVGPSTEATMQEALEAVPKKTSERMVRRLIGTTVQMLRRTFVNTDKA